MPVKKGGDFSGLTALGQLEFKSKAQAARSRYD